MDWALLGTETLRVLAAALLCGLIGLERQFRHKNAGVRTHSMVGMGACLFTIVGMDPRVISGAPSAVDTTRIAAQVVSGIGFLGAGVIFVNRDAVRGMTTAAGIWLSAAVGMACGAGLALLGAATAVLYLAIVLGVGPLLHKLPTGDRRMLVRLIYVDKSGTLRQVLTAATEMGFLSSVISTRQRRGSDPPTVEVVIRFTGDPPLRDLVAELSEIQGVQSAVVFEDSHNDEI